MLGAELGAPADGATPYSAARPEWYFLFLFQFLKLFESNPETGELIGGIIIPGAVMALLFLMPLVGRWKLGASFQRRPARLLADRRLGIDRAGHVGRSAIAVVERAERGR